MGFLVSFLIVITTQVLAAAVSFRVRVHRDLRAGTACSQRKTSFIPEVAEHPLLVLNNIERNSKPNGTVFLTTRWGETPQESSLKESSGEQ